MAINATAHGITKGEKRRINLKTGPKNNIILVVEREREVLKRVPESYRKDLENLINEYRDIFPEKLPKGILPSQQVKHHIETRRGSKPPYRPPYR